MGGSTWRFPRPRVQPLADAAEWVELLRARSKSTSPLRFRRNPCTRSALAPLRRETCQLSGDTILGAGGVLGGVEGQRQVVFFVGGGGGAGEDPLVLWRHVVVGGARGEGAVGVVDEAVGGKGGPGFAAKGGTADELLEPRPARIPI